MQSRTGSLPTPSPLRFAPHGWFGVALIALCWPLNWVLPGPRTSFFFFPLWLGYILAMDAVVFCRRGTSLLTRARQKFVGLFVVSVSGWWIFEWINKRTQNWQYLGGESFNDIEYFLLSSISFSTVMPAVFETAEWIRSFSWTEKFAGRARVPAHRAACFICLAVGCAMVATTLLWPRYFYPFVWGGVVLILEPINVWLGRRTLLQRLEKRDWRPVVSLSLGALVCGFFWEMWNFYSYPKWIYHVPYVGVWHVFEMPLLGYIGYIPFAWELYALLNFTWPAAPEMEI